MSYIFSPISWTMWFLPCSLFLEGQSIHGFDASVSFLPPLLWPEHHPFSSFSCRWQHLLWPTVIISSSSSLSAYCFILLSIICPWFINHIILSAIGISLFCQIPPSHNACGVCLTSSLPYPEPCGSFLVPSSLRDSLSMGSTHQSPSCHLCCGLSVILSPPFHVVHRIFFCRWLSYLIVSLLTFHGRRSSFFHLSISCCRQHLLGQWLSFRHHHLCRLIISLSWLCHPLAFLAISSPLPWMTLCLFIVLISSYHGPQQPFLLFILGLVLAVGCVVSWAVGRLRIFVHLSSRFLS